MNTLNLSKSAKEAIADIVKYDAKTIHNDNVNALKTIVNVIATGNNNPQDSFDIVKSAFQIVLFDDLIMALAKVD